jgi:hypothetical protein
MSVAWESIILAAFASKSSYSAIRLASMASHRAWNSSSQGSLGSPSLDMVTKLEVYGGK